MDRYIGYLVFLTISTATFALYSLGLNLQWGFTGLINFGHVAFMTVGAYTTVLLSASGVPLLVAVIVGAAIAALLGLLVGFSTLRLREDYLAIVTIGVSEVVRLVALNEEWLTRGAFGVQRFPLPLERFDPNWVGRMGMIGVWTAIAALGGWQLWRWAMERPKAPRQIGDQPVKTLRWSIGALITAALVSALGLVIYIAGAAALYDYTYKAGLMLLSVATVALVFWRLEWLVKSPWGRVLKAIREDEEVARALGKNVFWYKLQSFMMGGAIAGIAGAFYAWQLTAVYPDNFRPQITFDAWTIVVLGGAASNPGTLLGAVIFWAYDSVTRFALPAILPIDDARLGALRIMIIGLLLMVLMIWRPQGILGKKEELTLGR